MRAGLFVASLLVAADAVAAPRVPPVASYRIDARYDDAARTITGRETVTFTNRTRAALPDLKLHLYLNAWRDDRSTWLREEREGRGRVRRRDATNPDWYGTSDVLRIALDDGTDLTPGFRFEAPDDGNADDRTLASVPLPSPILPGQTIVFTVDFAARLPRATARTGWKDDFVFAAQWFPKLCKATDAGWHARQFHAGTEFWADFGRYDVTLTLPAALKGKVGGTGVLAEETSLAGDLVRVRFEAPDVHDFAWTASPRYEVHRDTFTHAGLPNVELILLLQPDHRAAMNRYFRGAKDGLARYGQWFVPYPYPSLTIVDPPWESGTGGMEYPTLIAGGVNWWAPRSTPSPEGVTVHEFGHQIFYGLLASNEFDEAHLDEGFNSWATERVLSEAYGDPLLVKRFFGIPVTFPVKLPYPSWPDERALDWQVASRSDPTAQPTWLDLDGAAIRMNAYSKTALLLGSAERTLGRAIWDRILKTYAERWAFRSPSTADFLAVVEEIAGPAARALLADTWATTNTVDYAASTLSAWKIAPPAGWTGEGDARKFSPPGAAANPPRWESVAVVRRMGEAVWPIDVLLRFENGKTERRVWDGRDRWVRYRTTGPKLVAVEVDPDGKCLLDVDRTNNGIVPRDRAGANRWSSRLRFWAQNLMEAFALLAAS